ncbi:MULTISPECIES: NADase-type glycan-binding domain-containing protein [unclassified Streptomyces]|uniref:NADase-type glycan-binding domain-containing protein n=1 Tax=unclassified Streptomyces TaxID=2593676 RepID=UPI002E282C3B|nr:zinc ribbon domain-containing protein [Streptomyces sp. NBC_00223]
MRDCPTCGASNGPADDFCGNCGSYLGWSHDPQGASEPTTAPAAQTADGTSAPPAGPAAREPAGLAPPGGAPAAGEPVEPVEPQPAAVRPAKPVAARPVVRPVSAPEEVVGPPCPVCGTPNLPGRRFCRRCASPLDPAAAEAPLPWWRTVWPFRRRVRAGSGRAVRLLVALAVVVALCAAAVLLVPAARALFEDTRDKLDGTKAVTPVRVTASAQVPSHPASNTTDGLSNRYWGAPGAGAWVNYGFGTPFRLVDIIVTNGASKSPEQYDREARALRMDLEVTSADGTVHRKTFALSDKPGGQTVPLGFSDVVNVRLVLGSVTGLTAGRQVAVAEVEFFQRG